MPGTASSGSAPGSERMRERFTITTDPSRVDLDAVHAYLQRSYWAEGIPKDVVA